MNVCLTNDSFPPLIDGVANTVMNYADIIQREYGNATVLVPKYPDVSDDYPYKVVRYPSVDTTNMLGYRAGIPFSKTILDNTFDKNIDIIHSHCPAASTVVARVVREATNAPIVMTYHTKFDIDIARALKGKAIQELAIKIFVANISACDEVWTVSEGAGENLRKLGYNGDYVIMKNGVDFPKERVCDEKIAELAKKHGIQDDETVFLFVGRMMWYKGCKLTVDSLLRAKESGCKFKMIFVGDGNDKSEIEKYAAESGLGKECIFVGAIRDRFLLRTYFSMADLFLFPSNFDTNGIVVREAAACSLASLILRGSCAAEDITDGQNGILTDDNAEAMSSEIVKACGDKETLKRIGKNASEQIYMTWEDSVKIAMDRYYTVIENYRSKPSKHPDLLSVYAKTYENNQEFKKSIHQLRETFKSLIDSQDDIDRYL